MTTRRPLFYPIVFPASETESWSQSSVSVILICVPGILREFPKSRNSPPPQKIWPQTQREPGYRLLCKNVAFLYKGEFSVSGASPPDPLTRDSALDSGAQLPDPQTSTPISPYFSPNLECLYKTPCSRLGNTILTVSALNHAVESSDYRRMVAALHWRVVYDGQGTS